ncbi:MAG: HPr family phosphocarrier protein [Candidatus Izemoplasmatales bacterium]|jgi:phosphocarrier protein|nr:HPr family phosphocarrier protein [Candidatus Izemoplasmatales bacterium]
MKQKYTINDERGLHARLAASLSKLASNYNGDAFIIYNKQRFTLKSITIVMSLAIPQKAEFEIEVIGEKEIETLEIFKKVLTEQGIV